MDNTVVKKKGKRINAIDVAIILLLLALIGTAAYRIYSEVTNGVSASQSNIILVFESRVDDESILNYLKNGDSVFLTTDNTKLGVLYDSKSGDGLGAVYKKANNDAEVGGDGAKITLAGAIRLSADARKSQNGNYYVINGRNISVGSKMDVYTETAVLRITVKSIEPISN